MKAKKTPAFRERKRFELRARARASRTLRKYGYCEADVWTGEEARIAGRLLDGLRGVAIQQQQRLNQLLMPSVFRPVLVTKSDLFTTFV